MCKASRVLLIACCCGKPHSTRNLDAFILPLFFALQIWTRELLQSDSTFDKALLVCIELHTQLHDLVKNNNSPTIYQELLSLITNENSKYRPVNNFSSIAWNIWHITRIEDAVSNILINNTKQILTEEILNKINVSVTDTGNAFTASDVDVFSEKFNFKELIKYRKKVGTNTVAVLHKLTVLDRNRKPTREQLNRLIQENVVTSSPESIGLVDFWSKKTISGLLTMPITRHQIVHINDCYKLVEKYKKNKSNN